MGGLVISLVVFNCWDMQDPRMGLIYSFSPSDKQDQAYIWAHNSLSVSKSPWLSLRFIIEPCGGGEPQARVLCYLSDKPTDLQYMKMIKKKNRCNFRHWMELTYSNYIHLIAHIWLQHVYRIMWIYSHVKLGCRTHIKESLSSLGINSYTFDNTITVLQTPFTTIKQLESLHSNLILLGAYKRRLLFHFLAT